MIDAVALYCPWAEPIERALRTRIITVETIAAGKGTRESNPDAHDLYWRVASLASQWKFRRVLKLDQLEHVLFAADQLLMAASHIVVAEVESDD